MCEKFHGTRMPFHRELVSRNTLDSGALTRGSSTLYQPEGTYV